MRPYLALRNSWIAVVAGALLLAACEDPAGSDPPDVSAPAVKIVAPTTAEQQAVVGAGAVELRAELSDSVAVVRAAVRVNDGAETSVEIEAGQHAALRTSVALREGVNVVRLLAYDVAGNVGADSITVISDQTGPRIYPTLPIRDEVHAASVRFFVRVEDTWELQDVTVQVNGGAPIPLLPGCSGEGLYPCGRGGEFRGWETTLTGLLPGANRIVVRARDNAKNEGTLERVIRLVPRVEVTSPKVGETLTSDAVVVSGTAAYVRDIVRVGFRVNGGAETSVPVSMGSAGAFTLRVPLVDANNVIEVFAYDAAGNAGRTSTQVVRPARETASGPFASVSVGGSVFGTAGHACALGRDGAAYCWGRNDRGQLGTGGTTPAATPQRVAGGLVFAAISAGYHYTCGVTRDGAAYCWGGNQYGQLGNGGTADAAVPTRVAGAALYRSIDTHYTDTCATSSDGAVHCWGRGEVLGAQAPACASGAATDRCSSTPVAVPSSSRFQRVTLGGHACALTEAGGAECWGNGEWGALGGGSVAITTTPAPVQGGLVFSSLSAGGIHSCGVAQDGQGYCWGKNLYGELGDGTRTQRLTPQPIALQQRLATISAGGNFSCAVTVQGSAYCWGENWPGGQLGQGELGGSSKPAPAPVLGGITFSAVSAGGNMACGLTPLGAVYCWGDGAVAPTRVPNPPA